MKNERCLCRWGTRDGAPLRIPVLGCQVHDAAADPWPEAVREIEHFAAIPIAAVAADPAGKPCERLFAVPCPSRQVVTVFFETGSVEIDIPEARTLHATIGGALAILDGAHPVQREGIGRDGQR